MEFASGNPVYQLDLWMTGEDECKRLLREASNVADFILIEGVMGLFDGTPSTASLAKAFALPVVGILNAGALAQTIHAISHGLATYDPDLHYVGSVANSVASERHAAMIRDSSSACKVPLLGCIMRAEQSTLPARHLGLVQASEIRDLEEVLRHGARQVSATELPQAFKETTFEDSIAESEGEGWLKNVSIAIARDAAFSFIYNANIDVLKHMGATLTFFSPLNDESLPEADCVYIPGGYPELHLEKLAVNTSMIAALKKHNASGKHIYAECGGLMYLLTEIVDAQGTTRQMLNLLPGIAVMQKRLKSLGYQQLTIGSEMLRGHTFHYSESDIKVSPFLTSDRPRNEGAGEALYRVPGIYASYTHFYFPSNLRIAKALLTGGSLSDNSPTAAAHQFSS